MSGEARHRALLHLLKRSGDVNTKHLDVLGAEEQVELAFGAIGTVMVHTFST